MTFRVTYSPRARDDLNDIYHYIAEHAGAITARQYTNQIEETCNKLRNFPLRGTLRDDIRPGLRLRATGGGLQ